MRLLAGVRGSLGLPLGFGRAAESRPKDTDIFSGSQFAADRFHIAPGEERAPIAGERNRAQLAPAQPCCNRLGRNMEDSGYLRLGVDKWRCGHAHIVSQSSRPQ